MEMDLRHKFTRTPGGRLEAAGVLRSPVEVSVGRHWRVPRHNSVGMARMVKAPNHTACTSEQRSNNSMQRPALRAAADAERSAAVELET